MERTLQDKIKNLELINEPVWHNRGDGNEFIKDFLSRHHNKGFSLVVTDVISGAEAEFSCLVEDIYKIVSLVSTLEKEDVCFIGMDSLNREYIVGIPFTRKKFEVDKYECINGDIWSKNNVFQTK